jgi:hypothetical protein
MFRLIMGLWYAHLRRIDRHILWPQICKEAYDINAARGMFMLHASYDKAWRVLGEEEVRYRVMQFPDLTPRVKEDK